MKKKLLSLPGLMILVWAAGCAAPEAGSGKDVAPAGTHDRGGSEGVALNEEVRLSNRIDYIEIPVRDVGAAKQFYGAVFGWDFVDYGPDYASFNDGRLDGGFRKDEPGGRGGPLVVFYDSHLEDKVAKIQGLKGRIVREIFEFPGGRRFHFLDPDGNEFAVWSDK